MSTETVGRCGAVSVAIVGDLPAPRVVCALPAGHRGWHKSDSGTEWGRMSEHTDPAPALPRDVEWALQAALRALEHQPQECPYHGHDFGFSDHEHGEPRCPSCRQPWRVSRALKQIERATEGVGTDGN